MDLGGTWSAAAADEDRRRRWLDEEAGTSEAWAPIDVPGHWRSNPVFAKSDGPLLYRRQFEAARPARGQRWWLELDGLFYQGDVWLDGVYLGDTEGYFVPHRFEVTDALGARDQHTLGIEVACPPPADRRAKRAITGVFQHWDCLDPDWNPGGLWRPLRLRSTGPIAIARLRVLCTEASAERAVVTIGAELDVAEAGGVTVRTTIGDVDHELTQAVAAGRNQLNWTVTIPEPALWWPHALGDQPLHEVVVAVQDGGSGEAGGSGDEPAASDRRSVMIGLRSLRLRNWIMHVNGERMFLKGANQGPTRMALGEATAGELARDVELARGAGLDLLRLHGHISRHEIYDAADRAGLLLWQDFPLQWGYHRSVRKEAVRQAGYAADLLGHHPAVALWCGHNEPMAIDHEPGEPFEGTKLVRQFVLGQEVPTWNRTVLDRSVKRALRSADPSRPVIAHSGVLPHPPQLDGTDSHLYFGWYHGEERELPGLARTMPRIVRFVSEFGAQALPAEVGFMEPFRWPHLDWERLGRTHNLQKDRFDRYVPPTDYATFDTWRDATQQYQAELIKHHVETLRRLKYRPAGGFCQFCFADAHPAVSWSVLDHTREPKTGFGALSEACRPVVVVADRPVAEVAPGDELDLDVHVVSDLRVPLTGAEVTARLAWPGGETFWQWAGDAPADSCVRVGTVRATVPEPSTESRWMRPDEPFDQVVLDLTLISDQATATNRYASRLVAG